MAINPVVYTVPTMVTGASVTTSVDLSGVFVYVHLVVPTMTGGYGADTSLFIQGSPDGVNFYRYAIPQTNTSTVGSNDLAISSSTTNRVVYLPGFSMRYAKVETTAVATNGVASQGQFKFICISNQ